MSDLEFDSSLRELERLEAEYPEHRLPESPVGRVGSDLQSDFEKCRHNVPMLSIANAYTMEEVQAFLTAAQNAGAAEFTAEVKVDGTSLALTYEDGVLVRGVTRGDGEQGDDVTLSAKAIRGVPLKIEFPGTLEVRGECYMSHETFERINSRRRAHGEEPLQNTRNASSGALKTKNVMEVARRGLNFRAFGVVGEGSQGSHKENMALLKKMGFETNAVKPFKNVEEFEALAKTIGERRSALSYDIDGIVIKVNDTKVQEALGRTGKVIKWACAYKWAAEVTKTRVLAITLQVGRTGRITPVAELEPIFLAGSTIRRATIHNFDEIERLGLQIGDVVTLEKGGEVIPKVTGVVLEARDDGHPRTPIATPSVCPACGEPVTKGEGVDLRCENFEECSPQAQRRLEHFVSKGCMDIDDLGPAVVEALLDKGLVKHPLDLYTLTLEDLKGLPRMATKSATKLFEAIGKSRTQPGNRFLAGLGIRHVGKTASKALLAKFGDIRTLLSASEADILSVNDIGQAVLGSLRHWAANGGRKIVERAVMLGLDVTYATEVSSSAFAGETVVFTGDMESMSRPEAQALVEKMGGRATGSVSKKSTLVVAGPGAGGKLDKARELGITILGEKEFLERAGIKADEVASAIPKPKMEAKKEEGPTMEFEPI